MDGGGNPLTSGKLLRLDLRQSLDPRVRGDERVNAGMGHMAVFGRSRRDFGIAALGGAAALCWFGSLPARSETVEEFFSGKQIKFVVGSAGGGGYEFYSRLIIPYLSRHLPGHPLFVMQEMPGRHGGRQLSLQYRSS
jgi:hypothetical protein